MEVATKIILIVEDDAGLCDLLNERIQENGFQTACAQTASIAFDWLKDNSPTLILLDYSLPDMVAKEFIAGLKTQMDVIPPFVLATGRGDERIAVEMMKLGARDYVIKDSHFLEMIPIIVKRVCTEIENENKLMYTQQALTESNQFNKQIIDSAQEGVVVYDLNKRIVTWNPYMENITGEKASDVLNRYVLEPFPFVESVGLLEKIDNALLGNVKCEIEYQFTSRVTGKSFWIADNVSTLLNAGGEIIGAISIVRDITASKCAEEEVLRVSKHYQAIIEKSPDGCVLIDSDGRFKYASPSALRMFGYSLEELMHIHPNDVTHQDDLAMVVSNLEKLIGDSAFVPVLEYRFRHRNGEWRWIESTFSNLLNDSAVEAVVINFRDISDRKLAEETLKIRETYLTAIIENLPGMIWLKDVDSHILLTNTNFAHIFGREKPEDLLGKTDLDFSPKEHAVRYLADDKKVVTTKEPLHVEELIFDQQSVKYFETFKMPIFDENNQVIGTTGYSQDISERKMAEIAIRESEEKFKKAFTTSPDVINITRIEDGVYVSINSGFTRIMGYSEDDVLGKSSVDKDIWVNATDRDLLIQGLREKGFVQNLVAQFRAKSGDLIYGMMSASIIELNGVKHILSMTRDITERKLLEDNLKESEERYRMLAENSNDVIWKISLDGRYVYISPSVYQLRGYTVEEVMTQTLDQIACPESLPVIEENFAKSLLEYQQNHLLESVYLEIEQPCKDGSTVWIESSAKLVLNDKGEPIGYVGVSRNITERKKSEEFLRFSEEKFRSVFQNSIVGKSITTIDGHLSVNKAYSEIVGYTQEELTKLKWADFTHKDDIEFNNQKIQSILKGDKEFSQWEKRFIHKDGHIIWVDISIVLLRDSEGQPIHFITEINDITQRKEAEALLNHERELYLDLVNTQPAGIYRIRVIPPESWEKAAWSNSENSPYIMELASDRFCEILGLSREEFERNPKVLFDLIHPDDQEEYIIRNSEANIKKIPFDWDCRLLINGIVKWVHFESFPRQLPNGDMIFTGILYDITERIAAESALKENRDVLNKLLFASLEFIDSGSDEIDYKKISDNILQLSGAKYASFNMYNADEHNFRTVAVSGMDNLQEKVKSVLGFELIDKKWKHDSIRESRINGKISTKFNSLSDLASFAFPKTLSRMIEKLFNLGEIWVVQIVKNNKSIGDYTLLFTDKDTMNNREIVELYATQVGLYLERLNSENALRKSEEVYRNLVMRIPDGVYKSTIAGKFMDVNPAMIKMLGYDSKEEMLKLNIISDLYFDVSDRNVKLKKNAKDIMSVFQLKKKDGTGVWIEDHGWYNSDNQGNIVSHEGVLRDITERKKSEDALIESERLLRESQAVAKLGSYSWDITTLQWTSSRILDGIFGIDENFERSTENWISLIHPDWKQEIIDYIENNIITKHERFDKEYKIVRHDNGQECWVHGLGQLEFDELNQPAKLIGTITNIDERKFAEIALNDKVNELMNFQRLTVGRELSMIELKKEINELHEKLGLEPKYRIVE